MNRLKRIAQLAHRLGAIPLEIEHFVSLEPEAWASKDRELRRKEIWMDIELDHKHGKSGRPEEVIGAMSLWVDVRKIPALRMSFDEGEGTFTVFSPTQLISLI